MISFLEVIKRALTGPYCTEEDFDMGVFVPKLREVVKKYDIYYNPDNPVPNEKGDYQIYSTSLNELTAKA